MNKNDGFGCFGHLLFIIGKNYRMGKNCSVQAGKIQHQSLGTLQLLPSKKEQPVMVCLSRQIESSRKFNEWDHELRILMHQDFKQVFYLPEKYQFVGQGMCGTAGRIDMYFQYYKYSLKSQISSRHHSRIQFDQTQLWYLLYNLLEAAFLLQPLCRRIGNIHPSNIVLNQKGRIKIITQSLFPNTKSSFQRIVQDRTSDVYLAPQEIDEDLIEKGIYPSSIDALKAEVFSIGVTMLMAATLNDSYYLYDRKFLKFNTFKKNERLTQISTIYSPYFCQKLSQLLEEDAAKRRKSGQIFRELNKYQDDILSLRKFQLIDVKFKDQKDNQSIEPSIEQILNKNQSKGSQLYPQESIINNFHRF